jgi:chromosomal replication initiation ATPase DnaA
MSIDPVPVASQQLVFDLPLREATGVGDFLVSGSNTAAAELVERWPDWPQPSAMLVGPAASGKSHLAAVWARKSTAHKLDAREIGESAVALFQRDDVRALVVEDIHLGIADQRILFHLLNHARETGRHLLLTSQLAPGDLDVALPDLRSRLRAVAVMTISEPDDALLSAVVIKLFADRQLSVDPTVINYLTMRMERSLAAARTVVSAIDTLALTRQRKVTRATAAEALTRVQSASEG